MRGHGKAGEAGGVLGGLETVRENGMHEQRNMECTPANVTSAWAELPHNMNLDRQGHGFPSLVQDRPISKLFKRRSSSLQKGLDPREPAGLYLT